MHDSRAWNILSTMYWSSKGWNISTVKVSDEDLHYAISAGYCFPEEEFTHDQAVEMACAAFSASYLPQIARDFISSLGSNQPQYRPALGSYFVLKDIQDHAYTGSHSCEICGELSSMRFDFSATNFSRLKWGLLPYAGIVDHAFILRLSNSEAGLSITNQDVLIFRSLVYAANELNDGCGARDLEAVWKKIIKSNRQERDSLIEVFISSGILKTDSIEQSAYDRIPRKSNWSDRAAAWRASHGINHERVEQLIQQAGSASV